MSPTEALAVLALTAWSIYQHTQQSEVAAHGRFNVAIVYTVIGLGVGGVDPPSGLGGYAMIASGLALAVLVGALCGRLTRVWMDPDGRVLNQGTALTVTLFVVLILAKAALGTWAYFAHIDDGGGGFGEVLVMIAIVIALQTRIVRTRARRLTSTVHQATLAR